MSLVNRLQREVKANPAKAAGLGVLSLVACYFWAPLILGFMKPAQETAATPPPGAAAATAPSPSAPAPPAPASAATPGQPPSATSSDALPYDWQKYAKLIEEDAKMRPSQDLPSERDPFVNPLAAAQAKAEREVSATAAAAKPITPAEAGLVLTTTLLGARKKIAEIDGRSYSIGDRVQAFTESSSASFRVVEIFPRRVVLEGHDQRYELTIPRPLVDAVPQATVNRRPVRVDDQDALNSVDAEPSEQKTGAPSSPGDATDELTH